MRKTNNNLDNYITTEFGRTWVLSQDVAKRGTHVPRAYVDICGGYESDAKIFAQVMYWHHPTEDLETRLKKFAEGYYWLAKNHADWFGEARIKRVTARKCIDRLRDQHHLIYVLLGGFKGSPTPYIRVNWEEFERRIKRWRDLNGDAVAEGEYRALLKNLSTPKAFCDRYEKVQAHYRKLSEKLLTYDTKDQTPDIKYQRVALSYHTPLIRRITPPLIHRITSNTKSSPKIPLKSMIRLAVEGDPTIHQTYVLRLQRFSSQKTCRLRGWQRAANPLPSPPTPEPQSPPAKPTADIHSNPYWLAFRNRWRELTSTVLKVPPKLKDAYLQCAEELRERGATPEQVARVAEQWVQEEHFGYRFDWVKDRIDAVMSADGARERQGSDRSGDFGAHPQESLAGTDPLTLEDCEAWLALPSRKTPGLLERSRLEMLTRDRPAEAGPRFDFWPARSRSETTMDYLQRRARVWFDMLSAGGISYIPQEGAMWADDEPAISPRVNAPVTETMTAATAWNSAYHQIELQLDRGTFETFVRAARLVDYRPVTKQFVVEIRNTYARDMCAHRLNRPMHRILRDVTGQPDAEIVFIVAGDSVDAPATSQGLAQEDPERTPARVS